MKIEKLSIPKINRNATAGEALRSLMPGQAIRLKTAQEWRNMAGALHFIGKERGIKFTSANDGDGDVVVFIKDEKPKNMQ